MKTTAKKVTLTKEDQQQNLKPYCENSQIAAWYKSEADKYRPLAAEELSEKLNASPETQDFTGTVVYLCGNQLYKIRVQRPDITDWRTKRLNDPNLAAYKALMKEIEEKTLRARKLETELAEAHPRCVEKGFVIAFMNK